MCSHHTSLVYCVEGQRSEEGLRAWHQSNFFHTRFHTPELLKCWAILNTLPSEYINSQLTVQYENR